MRYPHFVSLAGVAILACGILEPDRELELALVFPDEILGAPDTVTAGRSFRATVATVGSRYCTEFGKTDVDGRGTNEILIVPFNYRRTGGVLR